MLNAQSRANTGVHPADLIKSFLSSYIEVQLISVLTKDYGNLLDKQEMFQQVLMDFKETKKDIQNAVSDAFTSVMTAHSGTYVDYYCDVDPVPEPINSRPC